MIYWRVAQSEQRIVVVVEGKVMSDERYPTICVLLAEDPCGPWRFAETELEHMAIRHELPDDWPEHPGLSGFWRQSEEGGVVEEREG